MHCAGPALGNAAAIARAGQPDRVAQHPKQRGVGFHIHVIRSSIDGETGHSFLPTEGIIETVGERQKNDSKPSRFRPTCSGSPNVTEQSTAADKRAADTATTDKTAENKIGTDKSADDASTQGP